jgi:hypothetical protein
MGVIYALVIDVVPQYSLLQWNRWSTWEQLMAEAGDGLSGLFDGSWTGITNVINQYFPADTFGPLSNRFVQVVVNPIRNDDGTHNCYVTNRVEIPLQCQLLVPRHENPRDFSTLKRDDFLGAIHHSADFGVGAWFVFDVLGPLFGGGGGSTIIDQAKSLIDNCKNLGYYWAIRAVIDLILQGSFPLPTTWAPGPQIDTGYKIMTGGVFSGKIPVTSVEAAFDFPHAINFIQGMIDDFDGQLQYNNWAVGYISLRTTGRTKAFLGMQQFDSTGMVEMSLLDTDDDEGYTRAFENYALNIFAPRGILHWGQSNGLMTNKHVWANFDLMVDTWRRVRSAIGGETFVNLFMKRCGLA